MRYRASRLRWSVTVGIVVASVALGAAAGQAPPAGGEAVSRTPWGDPDLQGIWDYNTLTPLERPSKFEGREFLTAEEVAQIEETAASSPSTDYRASDPKLDIESAYNAFWLDNPSQVAADRRTSLIVDPPDGRLPALTPAAQRREDTWQTTWERPMTIPIIVAAAYGTNPARGPEDFGVSERCLLGYSTGPPLNGGAYNSNLQIFQTPDHVVLFTEMVHDARIVPLDGRPSVSPPFPQWLGHARGRWDGDTLVVETTDFTSKRASFITGSTSALGSAAALHLTERFTRVDDGTLRYEFTVNDLATFTRPFSVSRTLPRSSGPVFEYACHEGNYGLPNALAGSRVQERQGATK